MVLFSVLKKLQSGKTIISKATFLINFAHLFAKFAVFYENAQEIEMCCLI
jgi:hypothetical protein